MPYSSTANWVPAARARSPRSIRRPRKCWRRRRRQRRGHEPRHRRRAAAFDDTDWSRDTELRVRCLRQLRDAMRAHVEELREITIAEVGAPRMLTASAQLEGPIDDLAFSADTAESYQWNQDLGEAAPLGIPTRRTIAREAVGVVGAITPWNFPHQINLAKLGPALAAGNTVVLKPAPDTPWCAGALAEIIVEHTDFPPGVVNIVTSSDHSLGALLAKDPRVT
ncbi:aldehyde dehydrogenase family protein [Mycobacterium xenopi 4042]|uniref:Aldehyde dehydrogenase family protein n=1 Tax=Mycobacterium xenopi 4042 TaxID=1299334 RepID=X8CWN1_MYCXE|nr:aldehyde dehydrogenase family protein [Mycobacterium xenopi 4042]